MPKSPFDSDSTAVLDKASEDPDDLVRQMEDDDKIPIKDDKKDDKEDDEDDKDDKKKDDDDDDINLKDEDDDDPDKIDLKEDKKDDDEIIIDAPPKKKEVLKKYPEFFRDFPAVEKIIYRDKQYSELFGSFDDAVESHERLENFDRLEVQLLSGNSEQLLRGVKDADPKAFTKLVPNIITNLQKIDREAYLDVVENIARKIISHVATKGKSSNNKDMQTAAKIFGRALLDTEDVEAPKEVNDDTDKDESFSKEKETFYQQRFKTAADELSLKVANVLRNTIGEYIDPKNQMTAFVKKNAIRDAFENADSLIAKDSTFRKQIDRLWVNANKDSFSRSSIDKIRSAYLGKAKTVLGPAIKKARSEALKDHKPSRKVSDDDTPQDERKGTITPGRSTPTRSGKLKMEKGESVEEFLMRD